LSVSESAGDESAEDGGVGAEGGPGRWAYDRLSGRTLLRRFETEMSRAIGDPARTRQNVIMVVERLYGVAEAGILAERWGLPIPR
jgi:hypothetical protein